MERKFGENTEEKIRARPAYGRTRQWLYFQFLKGSSIEAVRGATTRSCFRLGIPSGHSSGSHSTARAISFTRQQLRVEGAFKQAKGPVRLCRAEPVKYARL
jgi:hypothetical protein